MEEQQKTEEELIAESETNLQKTIKDIKESNYSKEEKEITILETLLSYLQTRSLSKTIYDEYNIISSSQEFGTKNKGGDKSTKIKKIQSLLEQKQNDYNEELNKKKNLKN